MGKFLTRSPEDLLVLLLALVIVFGPPAVRLLAALITFRTSGRLRRAADTLDRLIRETEQRRARCDAIIQSQRRMCREKKTQRLPWHRPH
jgi:hypothetical protein